MAVNFQDVIELVDQLPAQEKAALVVWLLEKIKPQDLTRQERLTVFDSMTLDLGKPASGYTDSREAWYDDKF